MILAAIDIGSNAVRLLITEVDPYKNEGFDYNHLNLIRVPVRLGADVFTTGKLSAEKIEDFVETMKSFKILMAVHDVMYYKAAATSALRDASNGKEVIQQVFDATGIDVKIISGQEEADIIYGNQLESNLSNADAQLYIDVGGGSTELTLFQDGTVVQKESFNIGTVRLLSETVAETEWEKLKHFVKTHTKNISTIDAIGTGGNINKLHSLSKKKDNKPLTYAWLREIESQLAPLSIEERMHNYKLKHDRADVIVHALKIYTTVMRWGQIDNIYVPKIGMADGLIKMLHKEIAVS